MYIGFRVKSSFFLSDFSATWIFSTDIRKILKYQISSKSSSERRVVPCGRTKLTVAFRNFAEVPKNESSCNPDSITMRHDQPQHDCPAASVIAQQYSSAVYSHCSFTPVRKNSARLQKMLSFLVFACIKLRSCNLRKSGSKINPLAPELFF